MSMQVLGGISFLACLCGFWGVVFYVRWQQARRAVDQRLHRLGGDNRRRERGSLLAGLGDRFDASVYGVRLGRELSEADVPLKPSEWIAALVAAALVLWLVLNRFFAVPMPVDLLLTFLTVRFGPRLYFRARRGRRGRVLGRQLSEVARLLSSALKAGLTIPQGIDAVGKRLAPPAGPEFRRVSGELNLGVPLADALASLQRRSPGKEVGLLCTAMLIHREVGGDLASAFQDMATTLAERDAVNAEIQTITAEGRFVSLMLPFMPIFGALILNMVIPNFLLPLFTPVGLIVLAVFAGLQLLGLALIRLVANVRY